MTADPSTARETVRGSMPVTRLLLAAGILVLLGLWALASAWGGGYFVPPPWTTLVDTAVLLSAALTWRQILLTVLRVLAGFSAGFVAGTVAGVAAGSRRELNALLKPTILFFQGVPPILWAIPLIVLMGIGNLPTMLVIALITFPVVAVTVGEGMTTLPRELREMLQIFAPGFSPRLRELVFPHLKPFIGASIKLGLVLAAKASVTAEYFGANDGIGFQIQAAYQSMQIRRLFAWACVLILLILFANHLLPRVGQLAGRLAGQARRLLARREQEGAGLRDIEDLKGIFLARSGTSPIRLDRVGFSYRGGPRILDRVSLSVSSRQIAVIAGDSGIGKTTLLKLVASILRPVEGNVSRPDKIGFVFQDDRLLPWRSAAENVALPLVYHGISRQSALAFASFLLAEAGMPGEGAKRPEELSGGMRKRVALARCFARMPDAILLDEPFTGLHKEARRHLWEMFLRLHSLHPVPVLVVTHSPEEIVSAAPCRLYALEGSPATLSRSTRRS